MNQVQSQGLNSHFTCTRRRCLRSTGGDTQGERITALLAAQWPWGWHRCSPALSPGHSKLGTPSLHSGDPQSQVCRCSSHHSCTSGAQHQLSRRHRLQVRVTQAQVGLDPPQDSAHPSLLSSHHLALCFGSCSPFPLSSILLPIKPLHSRAWSFLLIPSSDSAWVSPLHL